MKRAPLLLAGLLLAVNAEAADGSTGGWADRWSSLWRTPDQRGEQLLRKGDAAAAAQTYADPRRKAYAELQAGDYAAAARDFGGLDDSDAHYDRGNALARSGDLQQALKAYDAALASNPDNRDARHNRDLVAQALKQQDQQHSQQKDQNQKGQDQKDQDQKDQKDQQQSQQQQGQQQQSPGGGQSQSGKDAQQDAAAKQQAGKPDDAKDQQADARNGKAGQQNDQNQSAKPSPQNPAQADQSAQQDAEKKADDAAQAQRDAANGLNKPAAQNQANQTAGQADAAGQPAPDADRVPVAPSTEKQLAQEQWLRRIPDDPGGLLRRKFMIEHMMREKGQQDQQP
jgi:Ca-activated chloride channel family protein